MHLQPVIKWSGSKRTQAGAIIDHFPNHIDTYYEPFVGGGSVLYHLLHTNIEVKQYCCSDINQDLIALWNKIKDEPLELSEAYSEHWHNLNTNTNQLDIRDNLERKKEYFYAIRERLNQKHQPEDFLFILRTCTNGLVRYNKKGEFNNSFHITRDGIRPDTLSKIIMEWSELLNQKNVTFSCHSYDTISTQSNDVLYLDPPYANTKGMYFGAINYEDLWAWLEKQKGHYYLSFDGTCSAIDQTYDVPKHLYSSHEYLKSGCSSFRRLVSNDTSYVHESLYIK